MGLWALSRSGPGPSATAHEEPGVGLGRHSVAKEKMKRRPGRSGERTSSFGVAPPAFFSHGSARASTSPPMRAAPVALALALGVLALGSTVRVGLSPPLHSPERNGRRASVSLSAERPICVGGTSPTPTARQHKVPHQLPDRRSESRCAVACHPAPWQLRGQRCFPALLSLSERGGATRTRDPARSSPSLGGGPRGGAHARASVGPRVPRGTRGSQLFPLNLHLPSRARPRLSPLPGNRPEDALRLPRRAARPHSF